MASQSNITLNDGDIAFLLTLLRNSPQPMTTQQLIAALRRPAGEPRPAGSAD